MLLAEIPRRMFRTAARELQAPISGFRKVLALRSTGKGDFHSGASIHGRESGSTSEKGAAHLSRGGDVPLVDKTIGQLLGEAAERWPNRECLVSVHQETRLTFADVLRRADRLAAGLTKLGLNRGDRLGIWGPNDTEWFLAAMGAARAGLIVVTINPAFRYNELLYCLQKVGVKAVISPDTFKTQNYTKMLLDAKAACPSFEHVIVYGKDGPTCPGTHRFADVESLPSRIEVERVAAELSLLSPYDGCNIQFTSGTTGKPKATLVSNRSLVNNSRQASRRSELSIDRKICLNVPFFHAFALIMGQLSALHAGSTLVLESRTFDPVRSLEAMAREKCDVSYGTPTMWINLTNAAERTNVPMPKLFSATTGGAPASPELFKRIRECFHFDNIKTIYGLTEVTGVTFQSLPGEERQLTETTVGHLSDHTEVMVVDEAGQAVPFDTPGELWVRGYPTMLCYWGDEENTKKTLAEDGWLKTGDQFILRADGYGHIVGRTKDMLIRGGENIFPKEVEDFLMTHPLVLEAQVVGAYDPVYGEEICACIRTKNGASLGKDQLRNYCKGRIAHFKIPRYIEFVDDYPTTTSGKIQKFQLKQDLEQAGVIPTAPK